MTSTLKKASGLECWEQEWIEAFLRCPACGAESLERTPSAVVCNACRHMLPLMDGTVLTNLPPEPPPAPDAGAADKDPAARVRRFYEQHPFPNYDGFESVGDLLSRASRSIYAAMLDRQIPIGARILEVGCGTGQLGAFLSIGGRPVVGVDMTRASLRLGAEFRSKHGLRDCNFLHASLFDLPLKSGSFDLVICKGVLHHTPDPAGGLRAILRMLRPGGYVICGLYNKIGRIPTSLRRVYFKMRGHHARSADLVLRDLAQSEAKQLSWYLDQYEHPLESRHSVDEVLAWFQANDIDFLQSVPPLRLRDTLDPGTSLFSERSHGNRVSRLLSQCKWIFTIGREGALFDMIGRKRGGEHG